MTSNVYFEIENGVLKNFIGGPKTIYVPDGVTMIDTHIIDDNLDIPYNVKLINIPSSVKIIKYGAFINMPTEKIILNEGLEEIGPLVFEGPVSKVSIPSSVKSISLDAFTRCSLTTLEIADIAYHVDYFKKVYGPNINTLYIRNEHDDILNTVKKLKKQDVNISQLIIKGKPISNDIKIQIKELYPNIISITNETRKASSELSNNISPHSFSKEWEVEGTSLKGYNGKSKIIDIPEGIEVIQKPNPLALSNPFAHISFDKREIKKINFPLSLKKIEDYSFQNNQLTEITFPPNLEEIGREAFRNNNLKSVVLPLNIKRVGPYAFYENPISKMEFYDVLTSTMDAEAMFGMLVLLEDLEEITVHNTRGLVLGLLNKLPRDTKTQIKKITIMDNALTFEEQLELEAQFPNLETLNFKRVHKKDATDKIWLRPEFYPISLAEMNYRNDNSRITTDDAYIIARFYNRADIIIPNTIKVLNPADLADLQLSEIILQEGLEQILDCALKNNALRRITFPSTLKVIGQRALEGNMLETLRFTHSIKIGADAFIGNPIKSLHLIDSFEDLDGLHNALNYTVEELYIDNHGGDIMRILSCFKDHPLKKIVFTGEQIPFKEKLSIMRVLGKPVIISNKTTRLEVVEEKVKKEEKNTEINDAVRSIENLLSAIPTKYQNHFQKRMKAALEAYQSELDSYAPTLDFEAAGLPRLASQSSPEQIKQTLLNKLSKIKEEILEDKVLYVLQGELYSYLLILNSTKSVSPEYPETRVEKIKYIKFLATSCNNKDAITELKTAIENLQEEIDNILKADIPTNISFETFQQDLDSLVEKSLNKVTAIHKKNQVLKGEGTEELARDIKAIYSIIDSLDDLNKEWLKRKMDNVTDKYIDLNKPLDEEMTTAVRKDLDPLLKELNFVVKNVFDKKDILNALQGCLKKVSPESNQTEHQNDTSNVITEVFEEIMTLLESPYIESREREQTEKKLQSMLESYISKLTLGETLTRENETSPSMPETPDNLNILPDSCKITIKIASQLYGIKWLLEENIAKDKEIANFKQSNY